MGAPRLLTIIGIVALLWNLAGDAAFVAQFTMDTAKLAETDAYTAHIFDTMPGWAWAAYGIAVVTATLGSILLLRRRAMATLFYGISVVAIVLQFGHSFLGTDLLAVKGWSSGIFPAIILILGLAQFLYARAMVAKNVLK